MQNQAKTILYLATSFLLIMLASSFYQPTSAQEYTDEQLREMELMESEYYDPDYESPYPPGEDPLASNSVRENFLPQGCTDGFKSWKQSSSLNSNAPWNLLFMKRRFYGNGFVEPDFENEHFIDLNGDGLVDYLFSRKQNSKANGTNYSDNQSCVYINNGDGFDLVYKCVYLTTSTNTNPNYTGTFYGDCAA